MLTMFNNLAFVARVKISNFFKKENGEVNIVAIVVLIGIAIILAIIFKDQISKLLKSLFETINKNAQEAIEGN